jgi:C4-dicarboxylate-specific signal transduction histidine kinase
MQAHLQSTPAARNPELRNPFSAFTHSNEDSALAAPAAAVLPPSLIPSRGRASVYGAPALTHDAGNILAALTLYCDLLEAPGVLAQQHRHYAAELRSLARRSGELLQQAVSAAPSLPQDDPPCNAVATLNALTPVLQGVAQPAELSMHLWNGGGPLVCASLPAQALERIALNLVRNAAQAIASQPSQQLARSGRVRVALTAASGYLRLAVQDNGPGLTPAMAASFLRPRPLPAGATRGFGHRIVHELATSTGGSLSVRVKPGLGTTVSVKWPLAAGESSPC